MNLQARIDFMRLDAKILSMLIASAAACATAGRHVFLAVAGALFWSLVWFACFVLRSHLRKKSNPSGDIRKTSNAVAAVTLFLFVMRLAADSVLPAMLTLQVGAVAALIITAEKRSHLWLIVGASLATVIFAAAETRSALFGVCLVWYMFAALDLVTVDYATEREAGLACTRIENVSMNAGGVTFAAITLCIALPLYLFVPKPAALAFRHMEAKTEQDYPEPQRSEPRSLATQSQAEGQSTDGTTNERRDENKHTPPDNGPDDGYRDAGIDIQRVHRDRALANQIVLFVKSSARVYLRGALYDHFDNSRWTRTAPTHSSQYLSQGVYDAPGPDGRGEKILQTIEIAADLDSQLYSAPGVRKLRFPAPVVYAFSDGTFEALRPLRSDTMYSVESRLGVAGGRHVEPGMLHENRDAYLQLPGNLSPRISALAAQITGRAHSDIAKALVLEIYLRSHYEYSFDTVLSSQGQTPLEGFLFENKRGHCEFFASALAVMLRTQGIATRVAHGFSLGERNPITGFYEVRALDGHAWVEAFISGQGWLMLEPTPFYPLPRVGQSDSLAEQTDGYIERLAETEHELDPGSLRDMTLVAIKDAWSLLRHLQRWIAGQLISLGWWFPVIPVLLALLWLCVLLGRRWLQDLKGNAQVRDLLRGSPSDGREAVLQMAEALSRVCAPRTLERGSSRSFREYYDALVRYYPDLSAGFPDAFDDARYGIESVSAQPADIESVAVMIAAELKRESFPRVRRELRMWGRTAWIRCRTLTYDLRTAPRRRRVTGESPCQGT
jgi:transglutaminase-like putative cysteine protease